MADVDEKKPFWVKCMGCDHVWIAAYVPIEVSLFVQLTKALCCPTCGADKIIVAKQGDGQLMEPATS